MNVLEVSEPRDCTVLDDLTIEMKVSIDGYLVVTLLEFPNEAPRPRKITSAYLRLNHLAAALKPYLKD